MAVLEEELGYGCGFLRIGRAVIWVEVEDGFGDLKWSSVVFPFGLGWSLDGDGITPSPVLDSGKGLRSLLQMAVVGDGFSGLSLQWEWRQ